MDEVKEKEKERGGEREVWRKRRRKNGGDDVEGRRKWRFDGH